MGGGSGRGSKNNLLSCYFLQITSEKTKTFHENMAFFFHLRKETVNSISLKEKYISLYAHNICSAEEKHLF